MPWQNVSSLVSGLLKVLDVVVMGSAYFHLGGFLLIGDAELLGFDEDKKPLEPLIYNPSLSVEDNLKNTNGLSWHAGCFHVLAERIVQSPNYRPPSILVKQSRLLTELIAKDLWIPHGWEGKGIQHGKRIGELMVENFRVSAKSLIPG